jgi:hypothetical protein
LQEHRRIPHPFPAPTCKQLPQIHSTTRDDVLVWVTIERGGLVYFGEGLYGVGAYVTMEGRSRGAKRAVRNLLSILSVWVEAER